jgi:hypothetical protein
MLSNLFKARGYLKVQTFKLFLEQHFPPPPPPPLLLLPPLSPSISLYFESSSSYHQPLI